MAEPSATGSDPGTGNASKQLILNYLASKGVPATPRNYNSANLAALRENAATPGTVSGLRNMEPVSSAGDPGMPAAKPKGGGSSDKPAASRRVEPTGIVAGRQDRSDNLENARVMHGGATSEDGSNSWLLPLIMLGGPSLAAAILGGGKLLRGASGSGANAAPARGTVPETPRGTVSAEVRPRSTAAAAESPVSGAIDKAVSDGGTRVNLDTPAASPATPTVDAGGGVRVNTGFDPAMRDALPQTSPFGKELNARAADTALAQEALGDRFDQGAEDRRFNTNRNSAQKIEDMMWPQGAGPMVDPNLPNAAGLERPGWSLGPNAPRTSPTSGIAPSSEEALLKILRGIRR